ncbi:G2/mitotic-specific cyclin-1-like [Juglans microcarpa x Juglans regia]|uniref:G2/mitotic-specific cyclin-1-like n=1 Tax=Juglans microcarpa x Juglans regia TaxID=2249226 RepID=UPI001B7E7468|nr:G2/mitotic-specific cyclin-1-like [Juglans microcarpa x Juglans regia]
MVITDENNPDLNKPTNLQGIEMGNRKFGQEITQNRTALRVINQGLVGGRAYPCAVNKRALSEKHEICEKKQADPVHRPITRSGTWNVAL